MHKQAWIFVVDDVVIDVVKNDVVLLHILML